MKSLKMALCSVIFSAGLLYAQVPDSINLQGRLSPATPIPGVVVNILRDGASVQSLSLDLLPDAAGSFSTELKGVNKELFATAGDFSITLSSPITGELLGSFHLASVPFSFTAGTLFSTGTITVDMGTLAIDTVNHRIGVGTADPVETLHVAGNSKFDGAVKLKNTHSLDLYPDEFTQSWWGLPQPGTSAVLYAEPSLSVNGQDYLANVLYLAPRGALPLNSHATNAMLFAGSDPVDPITGKITDNFAGALFETYYEGPSLGTTIAGTPDFRNWRPYYNLNLELGGLGFYSMNADGFRADMIVSGRGFYYKGANDMTSPSIGFGYDVATARFWADGTKSFIQDYPGDSTKILTYYAMEGPEAGIYVRGTAKLTDGRAKIAFPDYFSVVASNSGPVTAQVTPRGECNGLYIFRSSNKELEVREMGGGKSAVEFDYFVQAVRSGYENVPVVQDKTAAPEGYKGKGSGAMDIGAKIRARRR